MNGVLYPLWLMFLPIAMLQRAATVQIGQTRSRKDWFIRSWGRVVCLVLGVTSVGAAIFAAVCYLISGKRLTS